MPPTRRSASVMRPVPPAAPAGRRCGRRPVQQPRSGSGTSSRRSAVPASCTPARAVSIATRPLASGPSLAPGPITAAGSGADARQQVRSRASRHRRPRAPRPPWRAPPGRAADTAARRRRNPRPSDSRSAPSSPIRRRCGCRPPEAQSPRRACGRSRHVTAGTAPRRVQAAAGRPRAPRPRRPLHIAPCSSTSANALATAHTCPAPVADVTPVRSAASTSNVGTSSARVSGTC